MPIDPSMFGMGGTPPGGGMGGGLPGGAPGGGMPGMGGEQTPTDQALAALDDLVPKSPNPTASLQRAEQALDMAYKLVSAVLPQISQWNPKAAQQGHTVAKTLMGMRGDLRKEGAAGKPPDLMAGFGMAGTPGPLGPAPMGNMAGGMM